MWGNYIGTNISAMAALSNFIGIQTNLGSDNLIGGTTGARRNIISGNAYLGVNLVSTSAPAGTGVQLLGNYIGTNIFGTGALPNGAASPIGGGVDWLSDGDAGACSSNASCYAGCAALCGGALAVEAAQCTGFCSGPTTQACTNDADCTANGACHGPDPVGANANVCQCHCIDRNAHGPADPGDLQCNMGATVLVENAAPCDGNDVVATVGDICVPLTTQRATAVVLDANFIGGSTVPSLATNDQSGNPIPCATMIGSVTSGTVLVGVYNQFGSTLGDLSVGLMATCQ